MKLDDKVKVVAGYYKGQEGYITAMVHPIGGEPSDVMVSTYTEDNQPIDDFLVLPDEVEVIGHWKG